MKEERVVQSRRRTKKKHEKKTTQRGLLVLVPDLAARWRVLKIDV